MIPSAPRAAWRPLISLALLTALVCVASGGAGCVSPLIDEWASRGQSGVEAAKAHVTALAAERKAAIARDEIDVIDRAFRDAVRVAAKDIRDANGQLVKLDEEWASESAAGVALGLRDLRSRADAMDADRDRALANLRETGECFRQIQRLRRAAPSSDEVAAQLSQLRALVETLLIERRSNP